MSDFELCEYCQEYAIECDQKWSQMSGIQCPLCCEYTIPEQDLNKEIERQAKRIAQLEAKCLLHWRACDTAWRANEIQAKRIAELEGVREHAVHLLTGGGEEAVYRLRQALAATEQEGET